MNGNIEFHSLIDNALENAQARRIKGTPEGNPITLSEEQAGNIAGGFHRFFIPMGYHRF